MKHIRELNPNMHGEIPGREKTCEKDWKIQPMSEYVNKFTSREEIVEHIEKVERINPADFPDEFLARYEFYVEYNPKAKLWNHHRNV